MVVDWPVAGMPTTRQWSPIDAAVCASSLYENADIVMDLLWDESAPLPTVRLNFDGGLDRGPEDKLRSFLYYL